jgi:hypothetical protein
VSEPEVATPRRVSRFEANLLEILQCFLQRRPVETVAQRIREACARPPCLSRSAVELVQDTLAKGCTALLTRAGGWQRERYLRDGRVAHGRLWERTEPEALGLKFSRNTLHFLIWVTAEALGSDKLRWPSAAGKNFTAGDELLLYYAYGELRKGGVCSEKNLGAKSLFAANPLCRLAYPEDFVQAPTDVKFSFIPWASGVGACVLEAQQPRLVERWLEVEEAKGKAVHWQYMQALGQKQGQALGAFLDAIDAAGRRDLARFLLAVLQKLLTEGASAERWLAGLRDRGPTIAQRTETGRAALILLRQLGRLRDWAREARGVAFFEENYAASQLYKSDWERAQGEAQYARAEAILRQIEPL